MGRVVGTEDSTPLHFWVALSPDHYLQLDDVVICERPLPDDESVTLSGIVTQVVGRQEGAQFASDVFLIADGVLPGEAIEVAEITVSRVEPEIYVPPLPGAEARRAEDAERDHALFFDDMEHRVPIGLGRDGAPLYANLEFMDGTRGAHVNISGISGVATKTSYATFLLYSLFHSGVLGGDAVNTKALIFNVKGEDLLFLDQPNGKLDEIDQDRYRTLGLTPDPFASVAVFAPRARATRTPDRTSPTAPPGSAPTTGRSPTSWRVSCCRSSSPTRRTSASSTRW